MLWKLCSEHHKNSMLTEQQDTVEDMNIVCIHSVHTHVHCPIEFRLQIVSSKIKVLRILNVNDRLNQV